MEGTVYILFNNKKKKHWMDQISKMPSSAIDDLK